MSGVHGRQVLVLLSLAILGSSCASSAPRAPHGSRYRQGSEHLPEVVTARILYGHGCRTPRGSRLHLLEPVDPITQPKKEIRAQIVGLPSSSTVMNPCSIGTEYQVSYQDLVESLEPQLSADFELLRFRAFRWTDGNWRFKLWAQFIGTNHAEGTWVSTRLDGAYLLVSSEGEILHEGYGDVTNMVWLSDESKEAWMESSSLVGADKMQHASYLFVRERQCRWSVTMREVTSYDGCYFVGGKSNAPSLQFLAKRFASDYLGSMSKMKVAPGQWFMLGDWKGIRLQ